MPTFDFVVNEHHADRDVHLVVLRDAEGEQVAEVCAMASADMACRLAETLTMVLEQYAHHMVSGVARPQVMPAAG